MSNNFPIVVNDILETVFKSGLHVTLIGGGSRDFFLKNQDKSVFNGLQDFDFELRSSEKISNQEWKNTVQVLYKDLQSKFASVELLPYLIIRISVGDIDVELASPRKEEFQEGDSSHKNFVADINGNIPYKESFARRDFTINAIGMEFTSKRGQDFKLIDPYNGVEDLKNKNIDCCSPNFFKDPVRFLRLVRFASNFKENGFTISQKVKNDLSQFNLASLSTYYIFQEFFKSKTQKTFISMFCELAKDLQSGDVYLNDFNLLKDNLVDYWAFEIDIKETDQLLMVILLNCRKQESKFKWVLKEFSTKRIDLLRNYLGALNECSGAVIEGFGKQVESVDIEKVIKLDGFQRLFKLSKSCKRVENLKLVEINLIKKYFKNELFLISKLSLAGPFLGQEEFEELINSNTIENNKRSEYRFYFHIKKMLEK